MLFIHLSSSSISISITEGVSSSKIGLERESQELVGKTKDKPNMFHDVLNFVWGQPGLLAVRKLNLIQRLILQGNLGICSIQEDQTVTGKKAKTKINLRPLLMMGWEDAQESWLPPEGTEMNLRLLQGAAIFSILALLSFTSLLLGVFDQRSRSGGWRTGHLHHLALPFPGFRA